ncbi:MAG: sigma 54-interacting transcriptional regulator [Vicinamibacterales bacterium]
MPTHSQIPEERLVAIVDDDVSVRQSAGRLIRSLGYRAEAFVLITGETGTGEQLIPRAIHRGSPRSGHPIVGVNCAATPASLTATKFFRHDGGGAFRGAPQRPPGRFELAPRRDALPRRGRWERPTERLKRDHGWPRPAAARDC